MKVGLYSISYAGLWYKGRALSVEELISRAAEYEFEGIELDGRRPHGFPLDFDEQRRKKIRNLAESKGVEIVGIAGNNNFVRPILEQRENELLMLAEQIKLAHDLGGKIVRTFFAWRGLTIIDGIANYNIPIKYDTDHLHPDTTRLQQWKWAKECLKEAAEIAEKYGITLALQNHAPLVSSYRDILAMIRQVGSEYLKCSLDCPCLISQDDDYVKQAVKETGELEVISHFGTEYKRDKNGRVVQGDVIEPPPPVGVEGPMGHPLINYPTFVKALAEIDYKGYINYELCHPVLTEDYEVANVERVNEQVQLALEYMRNLIDNA